MSDSTDLSAQTSRSRPPMATLPGRSDLPTSLDGLAWLAGRRKNCLRRASSRIVLARTGRPYSSLPTLVSRETTTSLSLAVRGLLASGLSALRQDAREGRLDGEPHPRSSDLVGPATTGRWMPFLVGQKAVGGTLIVVRSPPVPMARSTPGSHRRPRRSTSPSRQRLLTAVAMDRGGRDRQRDPLCSTDAR